MHRALLVQPWLSGMIGIRALLSFSDFIIWSLTSTILFKFFSNPSQTGRIKEELPLMLQRFYNVKQQLGVDRRKSCSFKTLYGFRDEEKDWLFSYLWRKRFWNHTEVAWPRSLAWNTVHSAHNQPRMFYIQVRKRKTPKLEIGAFFYMTCDE